jgi:hypothetical protein
VVGGEGSSVVRVVWVVAYDGRRETRDQRDKRGERREETTKRAGWVLGIGYFVICKWKEVKEWKGRKSLVSGVLTWK